MSAKFQAELRPQTLGEEEDGEHFDSVREPAFWPARMAGTGIT